MIVRLALITDSVAAAGTALLLGAAAMSHAQQDPAAASAPFDARANGDVIRTLAQDQPHLPAVQEHAPREITVVAKRYKFEPARIDVAEGEHVRLVVTSEDGVHGVEIKKFNVNKKVPRGGEAITIDFIASHAGEFPILCSEYCGKGHEIMKGRLVVSAKAGVPNARSLRVGVEGSPR